MQLTLFCAPGACSRATMIALEEAGASYTTRVLSLMTGEQRAADYLAVNPSGKVPALVVDGRPLSENVAILGWLADRFPDAGLLPADPFGRAQALSAVSWFASSTLTAMSRIVRPERITDEIAAVDSIRRKALDAIGADLAIAERHMAGRTWWLDTWSVADAYLYYIFGAVRRRGIAGDGFTALLAHAARMEERASVRRMLDWEKQALA